MFPDEPSYTIIKNILLKSHPQRCAHKFRKEENDIILVMAENQTLHFLNDIAGKFFLLCDGHNSVNTIIDTILNEYDVDRSVLEDDIVELIKSMQYKRIVTINPGECFSC